MKRPFLFATLIFAAFLAGCSAVGTGLLGRGVDGPARTVDVTQLLPVRVVSVSVDVPETLVVSEANSVKPAADIVWRGDPFGDRYQQVKTIITDAVNTGVASLTGSQPVQLHVEVVRFHAVTERTRFSTGGVHEIDLLLTVTDAGSGDVIIPTYLLDASLAAFGGEEALAAVRLGQTQKRRISDHVAMLIARELTWVRAPVVDGETAVSN